jgi:hypothetical protein
MLAMAQCQKPDPLGASGSYMVTVQLLVSAEAPVHDSWGETSRPPGTPKMPDICAGGSIWPSVTSVLVTVKLGTTGRRANGSFMVPSTGMVYEKGNQRPKR